MRIAGLGALGIGIGQVTQALGVQRANASVATVISALIPLLVVVFAVLRLRQRIRSVHVLGLLLAIVGVALVAGGGSDRNPGVGFTGEALVFVSAVSIALSYVMLAELTAAHGTAVVSAWSSLAGAVLLLTAARRWLRTRRHGRLGAITPAMTITLTNVRTIRQRLAQLMNQISTKSGGSAGCRSQCLSPAGNCARSASSVSATSTYGVGVLVTSRAVNAPGLG
jgi:hypothetical protein